MQSKAKLVKHLNNAAKQCSQHNYENRAIYKLLCSLANYKDLGKAYAPQLIATLNDVKQHVTDNN